jgi:hypothetical protein
VPSASSKSRRSKETSSSLLIAKSCQFLGSFTIDLSPACMASPRSPVTGHRRRHESGLRYDEGAVCIEPRYDHAHSTPRRQYGRPSGTRRPPRARPLYRSVRSGKAASTAVATASGSCIVNLDRPRQMFRCTPDAALRLPGQNNDQRRIISQRSGGCVPNLLEKIDALPCVMRTNAGQPLLVALFHLRQDLILRHRTPRQKLFQQLFDVRAAQERMHVFSS